MATGTEDTRQLILRVAEELFVREGFAAVSMNQLVEAVSKVRKLSKPAIYYHFEDKETLYAAVMREIFERQGRELAAASAVEGDLRARVQAVVAVIQRGKAINFPRLVHDFQQALGERARPEMEAIFRRSIMQPIATIFEQAALSGELRPDVSPRLAAQALIPLAVTLGLGNPMTGEPDETFAASPALVAAIFLDGIAAR